MDGYNNFRLVVVGIMFVITIVFSSLIKACGGE